MHRFMEFPGQYVMFGVVFGVMFGVMFRYIVLCSVLCSRPKRRFVLCSVLCSAISCYVRVRVRLVRCYVRSPKILNACSVFG